MIGRSPRCYIPSLVEISPVPGKKIVEGFSPSWSCDPDAANKLSFPLPKEAPINLALIGQSVLEKIIEILDDDGRTPEHGYTISSPMSLWLR